MVEEHVLLAFLLVILIFQYSNLLASHSMSPLVLDFLRIRVSPLYVYLAK